MARLPIGPPVVRVGTLSLPTSWDVIVVGAGSSGSVLASRLAQEGGRRVLLVEAGGDYPPEVGWPRELTHGSPIEAADHMMLFEGQYTSAQSVAFVARGRVTGGSSALNGGMFMRGVDEDYDAWRSPLWSAGTFVDYFRRQETDLDYPDSPIHGDSGPIPVRRAPKARWPRYQADFYAAVQSLGFEEKADLAVSEGCGVGAIPMNIVDGLRTSTAMAYLDPARACPELSILPDTNVLRVLIDQGRATGVLAAGPSGVVELRASEVVLCASGVMTPHILTHSGIGSAAKLRQLGVPVVQDLPGVGQNAQDHPSIAVEFATPDEYRPEGTSRYETMLVQSSGIGGDRNDVHVFPTYLSFDDSFKLVSCLEVPRSRGVVETVSDDPSDLPKIEFRYLEHQDDRVRVREAVRLILELADQPALKPLRGARLDLGDVEVSNDEALDAWVAESLDSAMHTSGTCRMSATEDPESVVDDHGRVHGVEQLRVADISIAPVLPRVPVNATAVAIGSRIADLMLEGG